MNQKLLIVLPCCANDGVLAERLLDFAYKIHGRRAIGHLLIVANPDLHQEMRTKLRVTAELAFESVTETVAPKLGLQLANAKFHQLNNLFRHAALTAQTSFRWPWFWLEPDCVPVAANWIERLAEDYDAQPKKYMGLLSKAEKPFMARCGVYYPVASYELDKLCQGDAPFPLATAEKVIPSASHTELVQYLNLETPEDLAKISNKAVVVHGDKLGLFAENWQPALAPVWASEELARDFRAPPVTPEELAAYSSAKIITPNLILETYPSKPMQPQEIAKEIDGFLKSSSGTIPPSTFGPATVTKEHVEGLGEVTMIQTNPRLTRRQKRDLEQKPKLDCVATEGCKSSTAVVTP